MSERVVEGVWRPSWKTQGNGLGGARRNAHGIKAIYQTMGIYGLFRYLESTAISSLHRAE